MKKLTATYDNKEAFLSALQRLVPVLGLPTVQRRLTIYAFNAQEDEFHVHFINKTCRFKLMSAARSEHAEEVELRDRNVKSFLKYISRLGFRTAQIGEIRTLTFDYGDGEYVRFSENTFIGNLVEVFTRHGNLTEQIMSALHAEPAARFLERDELRRLTDKVNAPTEEIFDELGVLNQKIRSYADKVGLDIYSDTETLGEKLRSRSNDYSDYEQDFNALFASNLLARKSATEPDYIRPLSIVISAFESQSTILSTLYSIESQSISKDRLRQVEVIVVDDGSTEPIERTIVPHQDDFTFSLQIIRLDSNRGLATARNIGFNAANAQHVIFLDSDVVLAANYLLEHSVRVQFIPNAIFVSFKTNIEPGSEWTVLDRIKEGVPVPETTDDLRVARLLVKGKAEIYGLEKDQYLELLADTNYFKDFGYGRKVGTLSLPEMVIGHNISLRRKIVEECNQFSKEFIGWGLEDSYFGAKAIANGNFIIPVLSTGVYHINHPPRSGSQQQKSREARHNLETYHSLLSRKML